MTTPTIPPLFTIDRAAIENAGQRGGAYLERIRKTDLARLTREEWEGFCCAIVFGAMEGAFDRFVSAAERNECGEIPF